MLYIEKEKRQVIPYRRLCKVTPSFHLLSPQMLFVSSYECNKWPQMKLTVNHRALSSASEGGKIGWPHAQTAPFLNVIGWRLTDAALYVFSHLCTRLDTSAEVTHNVHGDVSSSIELSPSHAVSLTPNTAEQTSDLEWRWEPSGNSRDGAQTLCSQQTQATTDLHNP